MNKPRDTNQNPSNAGRLLAEARQLFSLGRPQEAEALLQGLLKQNPRDLKVIVALGIVAAETGQHEVGVQWMNRALQLDPNCVPALCWLNYLSLAAGKAEEARQYAEKAVLIEPRSPAPHAALARSLVELGLPSQAIPSFQKAINLNPDNPGPYFEFANALLTLRNDRDAAVVLRRAVTIAPDPAALVRLAYLELVLGQMQDAERYCRQALAQNPNLAQAHVLMGRISTEQLRLEEAEAHWQKAAELNPEPGFINLDKALAQAAIGHFDEAIGQLQSSIEVKPVQGAAYQALIFAKRVTPDDLPLVRQMEKLLEEATLTPSERLNLFYALGKANDNLGDYEQAMHYFDKGNAFKHRLLGSPTFDRAAFTAAIDTKIQLFSEQRFQKLKDKGSDSTLPILIVGMMRSGTTLAEQMLSCHPQVGGAGEQQYWGQHDGSMIDYAGFRVDTARLQSCAKEYVELLTSLAPGMPHVADKNPANLLVLGSFHLAFPQVPIVHTRRNAIDTAISIWTTPMSTTAEFICDKANIAFAYKEYLRLMDHWREVLPPDKFLEIRYEDLVANSEVYARQMVEFCGLEWDPACLHPEKNERRIRTPSFWQVRQPVYRSSTERWKKYEPWLGAFAELQGL